MSTYIQVFWIYNILNGITLTLAFWGNNKPKTVYSAISENKTWEEADNYCRTHFNQGRLVHITQYNVNDMFAGFTEGPYWIGLKSKNNQWSWNNGEPFVDGSYGWKRVTNRKLNRNGCIAYVSSDQWSISACNSSQHFICQHSKSTSSSHKTLELTTVQKMNTVQMSHRSVGQELTTKSINQQSSIKFSTSSIQRTQQNSKVTVAQSSQKYTSSVGTTMHSSTKGSNISMTISNSTSGFRTTISTTPTRPCIKSHSQNCTLTQNSKTHLARNITGSQSTNQGTQTKIKPAQTLTKTSTNPLTFTVVTTLKTTQTSKNPPASSHTSTIIQKITNLLKTRNVTMNRFLSTVNSTQSVKGTKTDGVWLKTSKKTVHTTNIRSAVTEAPTGTNQDADLVLILVLVLTLPLFVLCCITLMYCLLRTKIRRRWSKKNDRKTLLLISPKNLPNFITWITNKATDPGLPIG